MGIYPEMRVSGNENELTRAVKTREGYDMNLKITDVPCEMIEIGKQIAAEKRYLYTDEELERLRHEFNTFGGAYSDGDDFIYQYIYDHWMYGVDENEEYTFRFRNRTHAEKAGYITWDNRFQYYTVLNASRDLHILDNKYEAYLRLKKHYKREAILVSCREDLDLFRNFVKKHGRVIVKPVNLYLTIGLRWLNADEITDYSAVLDELIESAKEFAKIDSGSLPKPSVIVEGLLDDGPAMPPFNPDMLSLIRCTTVLTQDGVKFFYPVFRTCSAVVKDEQGVDYEKTEVFICSVDADTGEITSGGYDYFGNVIEKHPISGQRFEGTKLPEWDRLLKMLREAALELPSLRYIGWDAAYSAKGWCIIEGNTNGEFFAQMAYGRGFKKEFEDLIGWKLSDELWKHPLLRKEHV